MTTLSLQYPNNSTETCFDTMGKKFERSNAGENKTEKDFFEEFKTLDELSQYETLLAHSETRYFNCMANYLEEMDEDKFYDFCDNNGIEA